MTDRPTPKVGEHWSVTEEFTVSSVDGMNVYGYSLAGAHFGGHNAR